MVCCGLPEVFCLTDPEHDGVGAGHADGARPHHGHFGSGHFHGVALRRHQRLPHHLAAWNHL